MNWRRKVTSSWKKQKKSRMSEKVCVVTTTAMVIRTRNVTRRNVVNSKCRNNTAVDGKNNKKHEPFVVDSIAAVCSHKLCYCNGKIEKNPVESEIKYLPPPGVIFSSSAYHLPLSHQTDGFQLLVDLEFSKYFIDPKLICRVETRMLDYTELNPPMDNRCLQS